MTNRTPPSWYSLTNYQQQGTQYNNPRSVSEWYHALNTRRQSKCLFDLLHNEPELFTHNYDKHQFWSDFRATLEYPLNENNVAKISSNYQFHSSPKRFEQYDGYRILALFDMTHWHEVMQLPLPNNDELQTWIYPDMDKVSRYVVNDAKKTLKKGMMECDALLYFKAQNTYNDSR